ncbi:MAG: hypothetical protein LBU43_05450 [Candidatus Accumulibacter sp.]|nr:hypothetical protein [Accumulibacter sp.]
MSGIDRVNAGFGNPTCRTDIYVLDRYKIEMIPLIFLVIIFSICAYFAWVLLRRLIGWSGWDVLWSFMLKVIKVILFCVVLVVTVVCGIMIFDKEKTIKPIEVLLILGVVGLLTHYSIKAIDSIRMRRYWIKSIHMRSSWTKSIPMRSSCDPPPTPQMQSEEISMPSENNAEQPVISDKKRVRNAIYIIVTFVVIAILGAVFVFYYDEYQAQQAVREGLAVDSVSATFGDFIKRDNRACIVVNTKNNTGTYGSNVIRYGDDIIMLLGKPDKKWVVLKNANAGLDLDIINLCRQFLEGRCAWITDSGSINCMADPVSSIIHR